ncbi:MAG: radical SAM protein [Nanoarchaeota archaeon]|nr:radical SAM protein [Nanoarchaeota archaeon]MBU0963392.1 radical SAM protein [Nanoarchaeota archaeon]
MKQKKLENYLKRNEYPFNYEFQLLNENKTLLENILKGNITKPLHIEVLSGEVCNLNCVWCRGGHRNYMSSEKMLPESIILNLIDQFADYNIEGIIRFAGMSGEPLINKGVIKGIKYGIDKGLKMGLITNGICLTPDIYDSIIGSTYVSVSLDAGTNKTFNKLKNNLKPKNDLTFDKIIDNIHFFSSYKRKYNNKLRFTTGYILQSDNFHEILTATKLVKEAGSDIIQFKIPYLPKGTVFSEEQIKELNKILEEASSYSDSNFRAMPMQTKEEINSELRGNKPKANFSKCYAHNINAVIGADGNFYPCVHYYYNKGKISGQPLGNIYNQSFKDIWEGETRKRIIENINPVNYCDFCNRYDTRINKFFNFLSKDKII